MMSIIKDMKLSLNVVIVGITGDMELLLDGVMVGIPFPGGACHF